jgi:hypothetical protein
LIAAGVMSGVPVICCCINSSWTVLRPLIASTMTTIPKAMSTPPEIRPPPAAS